MDRRFHKLLSQLERGQITRRTFVSRAIALGATSAGILAGLSRIGLASAQEGSAATIGNPDIAHVEGTDKGIIKLYSSWPLTGSMERIGGDAVEAAKLAFDDLGNAAGGFALEYEALDDGIAANNGGWDPGNESRTPTRSSPTQTAWSTWRPTTPARRRSRFRSPTTPAWRRSPTPIPIPV